MEYAETWRNNVLSGAYDWSIFDGLPPVFDGASGTQRLPKKLSACHGFGCC